MEAGGGAVYPRTVVEGMQAVVEMEWAMGEALDKVAGRTEACRRKVEAMQARMKRVREKVGQIAANTSKATTVYSKGSYPGDKDALCYRKALFPSSTQIPADSYTPDLQREYYDGLVENVDDFFVEQFTAANEGITRGVEELDSIRQTGPTHIPSTVQSVAALLLFNAQVNPYSDYRIIDNFEGEVPVGTIDPDETLPIAEAPKSIVQGEALPQFGVEDFHFKPSMGDVPTLNVPETMLDLPGTADISWNADAPASIAPSKIDFADLGAFLPEFGDALPVSGEKRQGAARPRKQTLDPFEAISSSATAPPPRPQGVPAPPQAQAPAAAPPVSAPPPPPAPPAPAAPQPAKVTTAPKEAPANPMAALLDAIRNPNMKLKSVGETVMKAQKPVKADDPNDMMSLLKQKLKIRADAISGKTKIIGAKAESDESDDEW